MPFGQYDENVRVRIHCRECCVPPVVVERKKKEKERTEAVVEWSGEEWAEVNGEVSWEEEEEEEDSGDW